MMPEMDGIEATAAIRQLEMQNEELGIKAKQIPIIALTANAVLGMREMFIKNGFNDFISKPIDVSKLDEILNHWILQKKKAMSNEKLTTSNEEQDNPQYKNTHSSSFFIPGVDMVKGIAMTGGKSDIYMNVLSMFCKDVDERLPQLQIMPDADTLQTFIILVHALKGASASIGAQEVSSKAAGLEAAGKAADMVFIRENLPGFTVQLAELKKNIRAALSTPLYGAQ